MSIEALFRPEGVGAYVPGPAAAGPWDPSIVHGAAVNALFAGRLAHDELTLARVTIDFLAPVPMAPLTLSCTEPAGGRRIQRREASLVVEGREVATARAVLVRRSDLELPAEALDHASPFDPSEAPPLDKAHAAAAQAVGHDSFDSLTLVWKNIRVEGDRRVHAWVSLARPVVEGVELQAVEIAAVAADYGQSGISRRLPFAEWSFRNGEQTIHLARPPVGGWVGIRSDSVVHGVGSGFNTADLFDAEGLFGRSSAAVVLERRP